MKNRKNVSPLGHNEQGFTIVELMIALSILSVILIVSTVALIQIGRLYSKGVNAANLQSTNRAVVADISGQLQFSGLVPSFCTLNSDDTPPDTTCFARDIDDGGVRVFSYCIGLVRYSYVMNRELGADSSFSPARVTPHVLWRDTLRGPGSVCEPLKIATETTPSDPIADNSNQDGYEMLGNHMRLTRFNIQQIQSSGIYNAEVWMAFGDSDLVQVDEDNGAPTCTGREGTQFCAASMITTQLTGRVY